MAEYYRICHSRESGLSEVIGFVLIIGLLVVVASLYLTYGVPAQGREGEILHMNEIKDQFVGYKLSLDSLFNNNKVGTTVSNSFTLGTSGGFTQGTFSFIPMMSPVSSGGTFAINQRTVEPETLTISSQSLMLNSSLPALSFSPSNPLPPNPSVPSHINTYIDTSLPAVFRSDISAPYGLDLVGTRPGIPAWEVLINLTPRFTHYQYMQCTFSGVPLACTSQNLVEGDTYNRTDLTITVFKAGNKTLDGYTINSNIQDNPGNYSVNLLDDAYGLKNYIGNETITIATNNASSPIKSVGEIRYQVQDELYNPSPIPLGSIEYQAKNNYWIPQNYYYQMGGVFLEQTDGNVTYKLPPEITFSYDNQTDPAKKIVTVNINALTISPDNRGIVGGNSPIQIKSTLTNITTMPYIKGTANTKWIRIGVNTTSNPSRQMWYNYFGYTAKVAGIPNFIQGYDGTETYIKITSPSSDYDINVIASNATYATTVHGVGGIVQ